jgi:hypothetical protein
MKHFLNFIKPNYGRFEITEPIGFDAFSSKITQGKERFGRDKEIGGGASAELEFNDLYAKKTDAYISIDGSVVDVLTHRLDLIFEAVKEFGSESEIQYELEENSLVVSTGLIDVSESETDTYKSFKCTIVQNTNKALIERKNDVVVDVFSETDTFNNPILPLQKERILLKAKPVVEVSELKSNGISQFATINTFGKEFLGFNFANNIESFEINDTLTVFAQTNFDSDFNTPSFDGNFKIIEAQNRLLNLSISVTQNMDYSFTQGAINGQGTLFLTVIYGQNYNANVSNPNRIDLYQDFVNFGVSKNVNLNQTFNVLIPELFTGESVWLFWGAFGSADCDVNGTVFSSNINITATSTAVDSVILGVSEYNFWKQGVQSLSGLDLNADLLLNDKYVFNGNLIRQKETPLNFKFNDEANDLMAFMHDYQINETNIEIKQFTDFYQNVDMGFFDVLPDTGFARSFNDRFKKITLSFGFKTFEQNKDEKNTIDAVHTDSQFLFPNTQVEGDIKVSINGIYDPFSIETSRREATNSTTSLSNDDKIFKIDTVAIPAGTTNIYRGVLQMRAVAPSRLEILSNNFNWLLLGFNNGDTVTLTDQNAGDYFVLQHSQSLLELTRIDGTLPPFSGTAYIEIEYPLSNVFLTNRTNEGFDVIENIQVPDNFSNLKYTIKRILSGVSWSSYLSSLCKDVPNPIIVNTDFKVNGELITQFEDGLLLKENANIEVINAKILNKYVYKTSIAVGFERGNQLIEDAKNIKGFIRILGANNEILRVHLQDMTMIWSEGVMEIIAEARNEVDFVVIESVEGGIRIFEVGYNEVINTSLNWFKADNGYYQIFDNDYKPLINPTSFSKIQVNGIIYENDFDLYNVFLSL